MIDINKLNFRAILFPILISAILLLIKIYGWVVTDSLSILSSLLDSTLDLVMSILNMMAVIYAAKPPDHDHRFGHHSIEDIVGLVQATFIATSGLFIIYEAVQRFVNPPQINAYDTGILIMTLSLILSLVIVIYQKIILKKTKSMIVESDMMHYATDLLMNFSIIISLFLVSKTGITIIDPILATIIALYIIHSAFQIGKRAFNDLMDHELGDDQKDKIKEIVKSYGEIRGCHELKTRRSGSKVFIQMHIELDKNMTLNQAHDVADDLEKDLAKLWNQSDIIIHTDPV